MRKQAVKLLIFYFFFAWTVLPMVYSQPFAPEKEEISVSQKLTKEVTVFSEKYFQTHSILEADKVPEGEEFQALVKKYEALGLTIDSVMYAFDLCRVSLLTQINFYFKSLDKKIPTQSIKKRWEEVQASTLPTLILAEDIVSLFQEVFITPRRDEALEIQKLLGLHNVAAPGQLLTDQIEELRLNAQVLKETVDLFAEANETIPDLIQLEKFKEDLKLARKRGIQEFKEKITDQATVQYELFHKTIYNQMIKLYEGSHYFMISLKEIGRHHGIQVANEDYLNYSNEDIQKLREASDEKTIEEINKVREYFLRTYGTTALSEVKEMNKFSFYVQYVLFPIMDTAPILTAPLQIPQDGYAYIVTKQKGLDLEKDYIKLTEENAWIGTGRKVFMLGEGTAALLIALRMTGGLSLANGGWRSLALRSGMIGGPSVLLSSYIAVGHGYFDVGSEEELLIRLEKFNYSQFIEHTFEGTVGNLKFVAGMSMLRAAMGSAQFTPKQVFKTMISIEILDMSGDLNNTFRMIENSDNIYKGVGSFYVLLGNGYDVVETTQSLGMSEKEAKANQTTALVRSMPTFSRGSESFKANKQSYPIFNHYAADATQTQALNRIQEIFEGPSTSKLDQALAQVYLYSPTPAISQLSPTFILSALGWNKSRAKENLLMVLKMYAALELGLPTERPINKAQLDEVLQKIILFHAQMAEENKRE